MRKQLGKIFLGFLIIALSVNAVRLALLRRVHATPIVSGVPYTSILRQVGTGRGGQWSVDETQALRSDGSTSMKLVGPVDHGVTRNLRILSFASGLRVRIKDLQEKKSTTQSAGPPALRDPNSSCLFPSNQFGETVGGEEMISGYRAVKVFSPDHTSWYAVDYGCALIKESWAWETGDKDEKTLIALVPGEPDPTLFYIPASYEEVPPSKLVESTAAAVPINKDREKEVDERYYSRRPAQPR